VEDRGLTVRAARPADYDTIIAVERARHDGRTAVEAITSPQNATSIAFHRAMGFTVSDPVKDYDGPSLDRVVFLREIPS
jgi:L-amino acid N-acyltransferase YncA